MGQARTFECRHWTSRKRHGCDTIFNCQRMATRKSRRAKKLSHISHGPDFTTTSRISFHGAALSPAGEMCAHLQSVHDRVVDKTYPSGSRYQVEAASIPGRVRGKSPGQQGKRIFASRPRTQLTDRNLGRLPKNGPSQIQEAVCCTTKRQTYCDPSSVRLASMVSLRARAATQLSTFSHLTAGGDRTQRSVRYGR
jgi:hypothetical protein